MPAAAPIRKNERRLNMDSPFQSNLEIS